MLWLAAFFTATWRPPTCVPLRFAAGAHSSPGGQLRVDRPAARTRRELGRRRRRRVEPVAASGRVTCLARRTLCLVVFFLICLFLFNFPTGYFGGGIDLDSLYEIAGFDEVNITDIPEIIVKIFINVDR